MLVRTFRAMGSPCEVQVDTADVGLADRIGAIARAEALRIEAKFSRYRVDSVVGRINAAGGDAVLLDAETAGLIDYAAACHTMSSGRFDVTSGILRQAWRFDGSDRVPDPATVAALLPLVGWDKVDWQSPRLRLLAGMEIDLGGLGKEYAVDRAIALITAETAVPALVNFGGDLRVTGPRLGYKRWRVLIEPVEAGEDAGGAAWLEVEAGAITTSGDANRYVLRNGKRYGHILDPRSGTPVTDAPRAVTVAAPTCMEAGVLSTLAMLHGAGAEAFLEAEKIKAWITR